MGIEPMAFCVLSRCDNHYTTTTRYLYRLLLNYPPLAGTLGA